jgi:uncharacterized protein (TIGR02246 family)
MTTTTEDTAVLAVLDQVYAAWEANDADAFVVPYAEEATAQLPGARLLGKEAVRQAMRAQFSGPLKGSRAVHSVQRVRFVGADTAIVVSEGSIVFAGQTKPAPETRSLETWVLARTGGAWRVEAFHNCPESGE